jgi:hypothetical protein
VFEIGELVGFVMPAEELGWGCGENDRGNAVAVKAEVQRSRGRRHVFGDGNGF